MTACRSPIRAAVGDAFTDEEIDDMLARLAARAKRLGRQKPDATQEQALREAAAELSAEDLREKLIRQRSELFAARARANRRHQLDRGGPGDVARNLTHLLVGTSRRDAMAGLSIDARGRAASDRILAPLVRELEAIEGAMPRLSNLLGLADRDFEADVARELGRLNGAERPVAGDGLATRVAEVLKKHQDQAIEALNARGAYIGKLPGYVTRQVHDAIKVSGGFWRGSRVSGGVSLRDRVTGKFDRDQPRKAQAEWVKYILPRLDERTFEAVDDAVTQQLEERTLKYMRRKTDPLPRADAEARALKDMGASELDDLLMNRRLEMLNTVWTDIVLGKSGEGIELDDLAGYTPPAGLANKLSKRRVLHFKDADSWLEYHETYGSGSFLETYMQSLTRVGRNMALLEMFGPNPAAAFEAERQRLAGIAEQWGDTKAAQQVMDDARVREFSQLDGSDAPRGGSEARIALVGRALRIQQALSKLGGMTISGLSDLGASATALHRAGVPLFEAYGQVLKGIARQQTPGEREAADLVGVAARAIAGDVAGNFAATDSPVGLLSKAQQVFYRVNLFEMWQTGVRRGASAALASWLGRRAADKWDALDAGMRRELERVGIDRRLWGLVTPLAREIEPGRPVLTPDLVAALDGNRAAEWLGLPQQYDRDEIARIRTRLQDKLEANFPDGDPPLWKSLDANTRQRLQSAGWTASLWTTARNGGGADAITNAAIGKQFKVKMVWTEAQHRQAVDEAQLRVQTWFSSFVDDALTEPRAAERAILTWGQRDGTALGTIMRMVTQFKSFPMTVVTRNLLPTGREAVASLAAIQRGDAGIEALGRPAMLMANTLVGMTLLGYLAGAARDLFSGREPRPLDKPETWAAAFIQGGGAGFYADLLTAQYNRAGQGPLAALAGPSIGTLEQTLSLYGRVRSGNDPGASAVSLVRDNIPFLNLFYLRAALNYGLVYQMQEAASPGYLNRMEQRMEREEGRGFWLEPSAGTGPSLQ